MDDIIDTAGSITKAGELVMENGANSVRAFCTHPVFSGQAYERISKSPFTEVIVTDTIPLKEQHEKIKVLTTAGLFAEVIRRVENYESISSLFRSSTK
jgi:ribose-phosphate pyrophosphokinase